MLLPPFFACGSDILMAESATIHSLRRFRYQTCLFLNMLFVIICMDAFLASRALFEKRMLITFLQKVYIKGFYLNDLVTVWALSKQWAVFPKMQIHSFLLSESLVFQTAELALFTCLTSRSIRSFLDFWCCLF